eukprot:GCRY01004721.1.p1 GENE.GCRY01004721.1~~GCRY01004721.1.p1  ORF type:complete len:814 (+),score=183.06 GCRY01004721.1:285-2726(+)
MIVQFFEHIQKLQQIESILSLKDVLPQLQLAHDRWCELQALIVHRTVQDAVALPFKSFFLWIHKWADAAPSAGQIKRILGQTHRVEREEALIILKAFQAVEKSLVKAQALSISDLEEHTKSPEFAAFVAWVHEQSRLAHSAHTSPPNDSTAVPSFQTQEHPTTTEENATRESNSSSESKTSPDNPNTTPSPSTILLENEEVKVDAEIFHQKSMLQDHDPAQQTGGGQDAKSEEPDYSQLVQNLNLGPTTAVQSQSPVPKPGKEETQEVSVGASSVAHHTVANKTRDELAFFIRLQQKTSEESSRTLLQSHSISKFFALEITSRNHPKEKSSLFSHCTPSSQKQLQEEDPQAEPTTTITVSSKSTNSSSPKPDKAYEMLRAMESQESDYSSLRPQEKRCHHLLFVRCVLDTTTILLCNIVVQLLIDELCGITEHKAAVIEKSEQQATLFKTVVVPLVEQCLVGDREYTDNVSGSLWKTQPGAISLEDFDGQCPPFGPLALRSVALAGLFLAFGSHVFPRSVIAHPAGVVSLGFSHTNPNVVCSGGNDAKVRMWHFGDPGDVGAIECIGHFSGHSSVVTACRFSHSDTEVISGSMDQTVRVWDSYSGKCLRTLCGHEDAVLCVDISDDDAYLASGSADFTVRVWEMGSGTCLHTLRGHTYWVKAVRFLCDSVARRMVSAGLDKRLFFWSLQHKKPTQSTLAHDGFILAIDLHAPDLLLTASRDKTVKLWEYNSARLIRTHKMANGWANTVAFSPDGTLYIASCFDHQISIFRTGDGCLVRTVKVQNNGTLCILFSENSKNVICGTISGELQVIPV